MVILMSGLSLSEVLLYTVDCIFTQGYSVGSGLSVDPEGDPGQDHQQTTRHVDVDKEETHVTSQVKVYRQNRMRG